MRVAPVRSTMVLLDEPTANLDPEGAREVIEAVSTRVERTGATLIVVEHQHAVSGDDYGSGGRFHVGDLYLGLMV